MNRLNVHFHCLALDGVYQQTRKLAHAVREPAKPNDALAEAGCSRSTS
jgi:hypothetical protein